jgi:GMP synthase (glutamine-hydrolysing)
MNEQIVILDFGSQYTQVIARRIRECRVYSTILRYDTPAEEIARLNPKGIILSGGPNSVYSPKAPLPDRNVFKLGLPVLGICYGVQVLAQFLGGKVERGQKREYGKGTLTVGDSRCALFEGLPTSLQVWNSHGDKLTRLPKDFVVVGTTENSDYAAIEDRARRYFGIQFHPEVVHSPRGKEILANFVHKVCGCGKGWTMRSYVDQAVEDIRAQVGSERVILGLSGGVDSSVAAALIHKAIGDQLTCIFVNNGLLRAREAEVVQEVFGKHFKIRLQYEEATRAFLKPLKGVTDPERKRKIIGKTFIDVFDKAGREGQVPRPGDALSRRHRVGPHRRQPGPHDQEPPQRGGVAEADEVRPAGAAPLLVQGRGAPAWSRARPAEGDRPPPAVPGSGSRRPLSG